MLHVIYDCTSIRMFPNLNEYIKHVVMEYFDANNHTKYRDFMQRCDYFVNFVAQSHTIGISLIE